MLTGWIMGNGYLWGIYPLPTSEKWTYNLPKHIRRFYSFYGTLPFLKHSYTRGKIIPILNAPPRSPPVARAEALLSPPLSREL